jgi:acyl carrier protein
MPPPSSSDTVQAELQEWLCAHLAAQLKVPAGRIEPTEPMSAYGLDSLTAVGVLADVEERVGFEIDPAALWDYATVAAFTRFLADQLVATG